MINRILINREECEVRVAFLEGQRLVELHTEKFDEQTIVNNIYRGKVQDVVPGLQAAFIDCGLERNMFLHFMDIRPESLVLSADDQVEAVRAASEEVIPGRIERKGRRPRQDPRAPQASSPVKKGDEIIVQVVKDEIGGKAPRVTTNLSFAGRYLVLLPFPSQEGGVSRKISPGQDRHRLKKLLSTLRNDDHSFIVRTAGLEQPDENIIKDAQQLERLWDSIMLRYKELKGPGLIHNDHNLLSRLIRDAFPSEFDEVLCDTRMDGEEVRSQLDELMPQLANRVKLFTDKSENIFERFGVEKQIETAMSRKVWLKSGGYLIIDENEALTAIDVNTGRFTGKKDQEKTSLRTNLEACETIAEQIRVRDIGGIIVIDFIDMLSRGHQEKVSDELKRCLKGDRAKTAVGRIGDFGICMLTRKRQRMSLKNQVFDDCPYCKGNGIVLSADEVFRRVKYQLVKALSGETGASAVVVSAHPHFIDVLARRYKSFLEALRREHRVELLYRADPDFHMEDFHVTAVKQPQDKAPRISADRLAAADSARSIAEARRRGRIEGDEDVVPFHEIEEEEEVAAAEPEDLEIDLFAGQELAASEEEELFPLVGGREESEEDAEGGEGRRNRRRRETSAERRDRRRKARGGRDGAPGEDEEDDDVVAPAPVPVPAPRQNDRRQQRPPVEKVARVERLDRVEDEEGDDEAADAGQSAPRPGETAEQGEERRRTRRGRRGGRGRRRRGDRPEEANPNQTVDIVDEIEPAAPSAPVEVGSLVSTPAPAPEVVPFPEQPAVVERPRLKMAMGKKPASADIFADVLDDLERSVESLKENPAALAEARAAGEAAAAARVAARRRPLGGEALEDVLPMPEVEEEIAEIAAVLVEEPLPDAPTPAAVAARKQPPRRRSRGGDKPAAEPQPVAPVVVAKPATKAAPAPKAQKPAAKAAPAPAAVKEEPATPARRAGRRPATPGKKTETKGAAPAKAPVPAKPAKPAAKPQAPKAKAPAAKATKPAKPAAEKPAPAAAKRPARTAKKGETK